ncbi:MAG: methylated-DNA--[protein]-cysteine S-methyltransferase [Patescibacteria group bacterium]
MSAVYAVYRSSLGDGYLLLEDGRVRILTLPGTPEARFWAEVRARLGLDQKDVREAAGAPEAREVEEYLAGRRKALGFAVDPPGTAFQRRVWAALREIPHGTTATYGEVAEKVGRPGAARAVGAACGANPIALAVPCHRVVGAGGNLTGFGGGLEMKAQLLRMEQGSRT